MGRDSPGSLKGTVTKPAPQLSLLADSLRSWPPISDNLSLPLSTQRHANRTQVFSFTGWRREQGNGSTKIP